MKATHVVYIVLTFVGVKLKTIRCKGNEAIPYYQRTFYDLLAMIRQVGVLQYCACVYVCAST